MPSKIGSSSIIAGAFAVGGGLATALTQLSRIRPPGDGKGGAVMEVPEEEEVQGYFGRASNTGNNKGRMVMEVTEEEPIQGKTLLAKLTYQVCEDDIRQLSKSQPVSMQAQNVLAQSLGRGFAGKNQAALTKQSLTK